MIVAIPGHIHLIFIMYKSCTGTQLPNGTTFHLLCLNPLLLSGNFTDKGSKVKFLERSNSSTVSNRNRKHNYRSLTMLEETRYILYTFYKPFNQALAQLLNDSRFDYGPR